MLPIFKMVLLLFLTVALKVVEHANRISPGAPQPDDAGIAPSYLVQHLAAAYGVFNLHLSLSVGSLGVIWGNLNVKSAGPAFFIVTIFIIVLAIAGAVFRGIVSKGAPQTMKWSDWDWRFGVVLPNGFGFAALALGAVYQLWSSS
jgi:hypothetical protein